MTLIRSSCDSLSNFQAAPATFPSAKWPAKSILLGTTMDSFRNAISEHLTSFYPIRLILFSLF